MKHRWLSRQLGMEPEDQWKKEIVAGAISYFAVVYIVMVNAKILSDAGMPLQAAMVGTLLTSIAGCLLMAFGGNHRLLWCPVWESTHFSRIHLCIR